MEPQIHIPRWTPNLNQTQNNRTQSSSRVDESELQSIVSDDDNNMEKLFPFSSGSAAGDVNIDIEMQPSAEDNKTKHSKGIFITWKDLQVTVPDGKKERRPILRGVTGYAEPGEVLAIMGPSGSGKSTLLDALAGRISSTAHQTGKILINGCKEELAFGTSAYVTQDDTLMTTLTVREAVHYSAQLQLPKSMSKSEKRERAEMTIREMGLQNCVNTRIGGWSKKALSGGQKRRVSICIEILTRPKLLFLDEPTSGLDSASSYHVMNRIVRLANQDGRTVIASIHQPSTEVFQLFHNLCLLSSGTTVYFGSVLMAEQFFSSNGFPCPNRRNPSDHYLRTINKDFDVDVEGELGGSTTLNFEEAIDVLVESYQSSQRQHIKKHVAYICTKIFERERLNGHYGVGAFVIGNSLSSIPYLLMISLIPGAIAYYLVGLQKSFDHFVYFLLILFACMMLVESLMMIVASVVPDFLMGIITGAGIQGVMMLNGGFFRLPNDLPKPFWRYPMYYISFHKYANQGFYKNEFQGLIFPNNQVGGSSTITGEDILQNVWQVEMGYSKWVDLGILLGMVTIYRLIFLAIIKIAEKAKPIIVTRYFNC
ncbi:ABC transporter G family member 1-like isoform X1 [Euphorbia lathyris]|uniref:ABC transporter G family member 1-like isoform X1 n=1 Tax=Euphorbia lathyris TaxID=212925 RepID=UPI003313D3F8